MGWALPSVEARDRKEISKHKWNLLLAKTFPFFILDRHVNLCLGVGLIDARLLLRWNRYGEWQLEIRFLLFKTLIVMKEIQSLCSFLGFDEAEYVKLSKIIIP